MAEPHQLPDSYLVTAHVYHNLVRSTTNTNQHFAGRNCELNAAFTLSMMRTTSHSYIQDYSKSFISSSFSTWKYLPHTAGTTITAILPMASDHPTLAQPSICRKSPVAKRAAVIKVLPPIGSWRLCCSTQCFNYADKNWSSLCGTCSTRFIVCFFT